MLLEINFYPVHWTASKKQDQYRVASKGTTQRCDPASGNPAKHYGAGCPACRRWRRRGFRESYEPGERSCSLKST